MLQFVYELSLSFFEDHKDSVENEDYAYFQRIPQAIIDDSSTSFDQLAILVFSFLLTHWCWVDYCNLEVVGKEYYYSIQLLVISTKISGLVIYISTSRHQAISFDFESFSLFFLNLFWATFVLKPQLFSLIFVIIRSEKAMNYYAWLISRY